jgi:hypothetical protein
VVAAVIAVLLFLALFQHPEHPRLPEINEASAVDSLRSITQAARHYATTYRNGFPPSLETLGPPPDANAPTCYAADLIDSRLAGGEKNGYRFQYRPGPPMEEATRGCPVGVKGYSVIARPLMRGTTGNRSFYADWTFAIRSTSDDRPATGNDPPI